MYNIEIPPCGVIKCVTAVFWQRLSRVSICHDWTVELATMQYSPWLTKISTHFFLPTPDTMTNALFMTCVGCTSTKKCVLFAIVWYLGMAHDFYMFWKSFHTYIGDHFYLTCIHSFLMWRIVVVKYVLKIMKRKMSIGYYFRKADDIMYGNSCHPNMTLKSSHYKRE